MTMPGRGPAGIALSSAGSDAQLPHLRGAVVVPTMQPEYQPDDISATLPPDERALFAPPESSGLHVPILMYHYVRVNPIHWDRLGFSLSVTPADFARQLDLLRSTGFHSISLGQLMDAIEHGATLPAHPVVLTFDDGYSDFADVAVPQLLAHGFTATDFVVSGFVGHSGYMSAAQVVAVHRLGMTIGAHTIHHANLAITAPWLAQIEIAQSRRDLEQLIGVPVTDFAYPSGKFDSAVLAMVAAAGYRDAVTTIEGVASDAGHRLLLPRVRVSGGEMFADFAKALGILPAGAPADSTPADSTPGVTAPSEAVENTDVWDGLGGPR
jgi:peptidoglycan/xylan/chitin deacetylase (PgdA/CDA1 family)